MDALFLKSDKETMSLEMSIGFMAALPLYTEFVSKLGRNPVPFKHEFLYEKYPCHKRLTNWKNLFPL
jgi:hypothetical protein